MITFADYLFFTVNIKFSRRVLSNGLSVIFHQDKYSPLAAINILYNVGAKDEEPDKTGFAHLFEHLMFGGSVNIPSFDTPLQKAGGENNAFTNNDFTNYYITLPKENIETALWLESDRMMELNFSESSLNVQKKVVIEEFNQRYLNQPYGDISLLFRPLCYTTHPYRWPTIGMDISHIENAALNDVRDFFYRHYNPQNAILVISGDFEANLIFDLTEKWFGGIRRSHTYKRQLPAEPTQNKARRLVVERKVPHHCITISFPMSNRLHEDYFTWDLLSDLLSHGNSSRLPLKLVREQQIFSDIEAYISGSIDEGQFIIHGDILPGISCEAAENAIWAELEKLKKNEISENEMKKLINQAETSNIFRNIGILSKAMNLGYYEMLGNAEMINLEIQNYLKINSENIQQLASEHLITSRSSTLIYKSELLKNE